ncbi:hypothetical protein HDU67_002123 [Dinochytrium kinnereticum]|nr:hypothetical protein HDU67_002123 [Dinochytrium kinnereticum]
MKSKPNFTHPTNPLAMINSSPNHVLINNVLMPLNPTTGRPEVGPAVHIINDRGMPVLGPLIPGDAYKLVCAWDVGTLDWATASALKLERRKWEEAMQSRYGVKEAATALRVIGGQRITAGMLYT